MRFNPAQFTRARTRPRHTPGEMNGAERKYAAHLDQMKLVGLIQKWEFERLTVKLGPDLRYVIDFYIVLADGLIECVDVKGTKKNKSTGEENYTAEEKALVKIKSAAQQFPEFAWKVAWLRSDGWAHKEFTA